MNPSPRRIPTLLVYTAMLALAVGAYLLIRHLGETGLTAPAPAAPGDATPGHAASGPFAHVLLSLATITLAARFVGGVFRRYLRQPPVLGEILAGIALGPSLLGRVAPDAAAFLLPAEVSPSISLIAKVGVILFMFLVGLDLDTTLLRGKSHVTLAISHASILAPFVLGTGLALAIYPRYSSSDVSFTVFSLFLGVSLSVTAFPVLARILTDRGVHRTPLGVTALACAAVNDATAWALLAFVAGVASAKIEGAGWTALALVGYVTVMFVVVRPLVRHFACRTERGEGPLSRTALAIVFVALLASAMATEAIGIHALFGAFLLGALLPPDGRLADALRARLEDIVIVLFLPCFFAYTGMRMQIARIDHVQDWLFCGLIVLAATAGKFGGTFLAGRAAGLDAREAGALGVLMNTRGLMELIVLNLGLDLGVISPTVFAMLVVMALVTTFATTPILDLILGKRGFEAARAKAV